ncbi:MAG: TonB-dependent receptor [Candidatus Sulfotelmatobacter sp.]|jgi:carboxypeptidase family protein
MKNISRQTAFALTLFAILLSATLQAQNSRGSLRGTVQDATGARIASAKIVAQLSGSSVEREASSEERGEFFIDDLLPGSYRVTISAKGFAPAQAEVSVAVANVRDITVMMKPAATSQTVNVQGSSSSITTEIIDTSSAVRGGVVGSQDLETLPLPARSFANIAYLVPGTEPVEPSDPTKARITAVSTGGSSGLNNELSVDGAENSDDWIGGFLQNFSPDGVQEFAVRTSNEDADTGWTTAGSVVITTKRGTNGWHGDAAFYDRQAALNARFPIENPAPNPKQPFSRQNYVATIGGPIAKDKVWFFTSFENVHENASIAYSPASTTQFDALSQLASEGLITGIPSIPVPNFVPIPFRDYLSSLRFDWAQSPKSTWFLRASSDSYLTHNALVQQATLPSTGLTTHNNYWNVALSNTYTFSPTWLGSLVLDASLLHLTQTRNSDLGFAIQFPFSVTALTVSGFETFGDNQFATPITLFPDLRNQDKYQFRYDLSHVMGTHAFKFGIDFIHEPVLGGAFASTAEQFTTYPSNPDCYINPPGPDCGGITTALPFYYTPPSAMCNPMPDPSTGIGCTFTPAGDGTFSQNVQRLGLYAEDSWRVSHRLTVNYGLRYQTTWGLFIGSGRSQAENPAYLTLQALDITTVPSVPTDYRKQIAPRLGIAYSPGSTGKTVIRAGFGLYYDDLAQNGWATAFQGVNNSNYATGPCSFSGGTFTGAGCLTGGASATGNLIGAPYKTPYSVHTTGGVQHAFNERWLASADYVHEQGNHGYRGFPYAGGTNLFTPFYPTTDVNDQTAVVPNVNVFEADNRSGYNGLMLHLQGNMRRFNLVANYTFSKAQTWGCLLGELFDYVDGVCPNEPGTPNAGLLNAFGPGDYGPSGEDVRHRFVLAGIVHLPGGFELSTINQFESARPITITNADNTDRISVSLNNGPDMYTSLDEFRGTPYLQSDLRVTRPININERWRIDPFVEFFNLFNRNNPGANFAVNIAQIPGAQFDAGGAVNGICNPNCVPLTSLKQLEIPEGALGDFFGPGTTVGIPFAAQLGVRVTF